MRSLLTQSSGRVFTRLCTLLVPPRPSVVMGSTSKRSRAKSEVASPEVTDAPATAPAPEAPTTPPPPRKRSKKSKTAATVVMEQSQVVTAILPSLASLAALSSQTPAPPTDTEVLPPPKREVLVAPLQTRVRVGEPLVRLGPLIPGIVIKRPSAVIKTPYVADVQLEVAGEEEERAEPRIVQAHAPGMDCAGITQPGSRVWMTENVKKEPKTPGRTKSKAAGRTDSQAGLLPAGSQALTGFTESQALAGLMVTPGSQVPGADEGLGEGSQAVAAAVAAPVKKTTSHAIQMVEDGRQGHGNHLVGYHPSLAERIIREAMSRGLLAGLLGEHVTLESQKTFGDMRVDFVLHHADGSRTLVEVKNVPGTDIHEDMVPEGKSKIRTFKSTSPEDGSGWVRTALFPHGTRKPGIKVVSDRAIKHIHELTRLQQQGYIDGDKEGGKVQCAVLFMVGRSDCGQFRPCDEADPLFANAVKNAQDNGVKIIAHDVSMDASTGEAWWGRPLPVVYSPQVTGEVDMEHLEKVLHFNQTDPQKHWKRLKAEKAAREVSQQVDDGTAGIAAAAAAEGGTLARSGSKGRKATTRTTTVTTAHRLGTMTTSVAVVSAKGKRRRKQQESSEEMEDDSSGDSDSGELLTGATTINSGVAEDEAEVQGKKPNKTKGGAVVMASRRNGRSLPSRSSRPKKAMKDASTEEEEEE